MSSPSPFLLFADAPPLKKGGIGTHTLGRNLLEGLPDCFGMVVTRRMNPSLRRADFYEAPGLRTFVLPDMPAFRPRRFRALVDFLLFVLSLPWTAAAVRRSGCQRIFALCAAESYFLPKAELLRRATGLPLDLYLVDDFEESARLVGLPLVAWVVRRAEPYFLRRADRVFVISRGYVEHLAHKYGQAAIWLPVLAPEPPLTPAPFRATEAAGSRPIVFTGSLNPLYANALRDLHAEITRWNAAPDRPFALHLTLLVAHDPAQWVASLPNQDHLEILIGLDPASRAERARTAWATFLPYSFDPAQRVMVSTSFPTKFTDFTASGRPILVYGPAEASIPRCFREEGLPLCAGSAAELRTVLGDIETRDTPALIERYRALVRRYFSPGNLRRVLCDPPTDNASGAAGATPG